MLTKSIEMPTAGVEPADRESTTEDPMYVLASAIVEPASISGGAAKCMQKFLSHGLPIDLRLCLYQSVV